MPVTRLAMVWIDQAGSTTMRYYDTADDSGETIVAKLAAKSGAAQLEFWKGDLTVYPAPAPPGGQYQQVGMYAQLVFSDGMNNTTVILPAPSASIFKADGVTVDPAQIADIIDAVVGHAVTASGSVVTAFVTGTLRGKGYT